MDLFKRFQAGRFAKKLAASNGVDDAMVDAQNQLVSMGPSAVRSVFDLIAQGPPSEATLSVLERLLNNDSLNLFLEALRHPQTSVADAATLVLERAEAYDPTQLLALFADPTISKARLEPLLEAQSRRVQAATPLPVLPHLGQEARGTAFRRLRRP